MWLLELSCWRWVRVDLVPNTPDIFKSPEISFAVLRLEVKGFKPARQVLYHWAMCSAQGNFAPTELCPQPKETLFPLSYALNPKRHCKASGSNRYFQNISKKHKRIYFFFCTLQNFLQNLTHTQIQSKSQQLEENWHNSLHPIRLLQLTGGYWFHYV